MDLFDIHANNALKKEAPLAARMRPRTINEFFGQEHIVGDGKILNRAIKADKISSVIFYGPPGTGKTTLAKIISNSTKSFFVQINATTAGIKDIKEAVEKAKYNLALSGKKTILFIDEIHRFNKNQQDALLPHVEDGTLIMIGATTENPYFEVIKALVSRSMVLELFRLTTQDIIKILNSAISDKERGMGVYNCKVSEEAVEFLADVANGDARAALNAIELAILTTGSDENGKIIIDIDAASDSIQKKAIIYDKAGDNHYDVISAFIKSMRGSDPDATLYYLARMIYAGEDPMFIARRILICAAEDVGLAEPSAVSVAASAMTAVSYVGMPEARIILSHAALFVATAPKSNASYHGIEKALEDVKVNIKTVPHHLTNAPIKEMKNIGRGVGYKYAHDYKNHYVKQQYLPDELEGKIYYNPTDIGYENIITKHLNFLKDNS